MPTWLCTPAAVYLKRHVRTSKYDPILDKVNLVHPTPNYAVVQLPSGRETTVSLRDIASCTNSETSDPTVYNGDLVDESAFTDYSVDVPRNLNDVPNAVDIDVGVEPNLQTNVREQPFSHVETNIPTNNEPISSHTESTQSLRRSSRVSKAVDRYGAAPYVECLIDSLLLRCILLRERECCVICCKTSHFSCFLD